MDVIQAYVRRHKGCVILIVGIPVEYSNHHVLAKTLTHYIKDKMIDPEIEIKHISIYSDTDVTKVTEMLFEFSGLIVVSSNVIYKDMMTPDFSFFIDTTLEVLTQRGMMNTLDIKNHNWDILKSEIKYNRFINDYTPSLIKKPGDVLNSKNAWKTFFNLWSATMRLFVEVMNAEDSGKRTITERV